MITEFHSTSERRKGGKGTLQHQEQKEQKEDNWPKAPSFSSKKVPSNSPRHLLQMSNSTSLDFINMTATTFNWHQSILKHGSWELITPEWLLLNLCSKVQGYPGVEVWYHSE